MRLHTGHKPYKCDVCEREFTHSNSLQRHTRTHTGEKPYTCDVCGKAFTDMSNMKSHKKRNHTKEVILQEEEVEHEVE